jgi:hypothetical protein
MIPRTVCLRTLALVCGVLMVASGVIGQVYEGGCYSFYDANCGSPSTGCGVCVDNCDMQAVRFTSYRKKLIAGSGSSGYVQEVVDCKQTFSCEWVGNMDCGSPPVSKKICLQSSRITNNLLCQDPPCTQTATEQRELQPLQQCGGCGLGCQW